MFYRSSSLQTLLQKNSDTPSAAVDYQTIDTTLPTDGFISNIPLLIFWAGVGVVAYLFTSAIVSALRSAVELEEEMNFVHARRKDLIQYAAERLIIRLGALLAWVFYLQYTLHTIVPYAIAVGYAGTLEASWMLGVLYVLGAVAILIISGHAHTMLIRLIALRPRLFN
jgi:hypothetical protein